MTDGIDASDGTDGMHTQAVVDPATAVGACGIDNSEGMQTQVVANTVPAAGADGMDHHGVMVSEDVLFSGLGTHGAETDRIPGPGGIPIAVLATGRSRGSGGVSQGISTIAQSSAQTWLGGGCMTAADVQQSAPTTGADRIDYFDLR